MTSTSDRFTLRFVKLFPLACVFLTLAATRGADPRVSNRPPAPDEVGYRPADGATNPLNPPSFIWLHEPAAVTYDFECSPDPDFKSAVARSNIPWNTWTPGEPLDPGKFHWRYRFRNGAGATSAWSVVRTVTVPASAAVFPMPDRSRQKERVPQGHPRLFLRPEDVSGLRELAAGREKAKFEALRAEAERLIRNGPTPEPEHLGSARDKNNPEMVKYWWPNRTQTEKACMEAETLAFVYLMSGERKYGEAARRWVLHLASWNPDGPTNFKLNCEAGKPMLFRPARAYDWAWDMFSEEDRAKIRAITSRRIKDAWESGEIARGTGHLNRPFNSHGNRVWHKVGEAGIAFLGEIPEAATWLDYAVNKFYSCYPVWADDDGGWHEGVSYWSGYMTKAVWWLQVAESALGIDGLKKPFFARVGDYPLYIAPPGSPNSGFGDLSHNPPGTGTASFMEYHIRMRGAQPDGRQAGYWRWWMDQWKTRPTGGILGFLYAAKLPPAPAPTPPNDLPLSKVFHGIGVASLHTSLLDSKDDVHFLMKSSPFGSQSHGHNPHNSFQLNAYGDALLTPCVYRDLHGSKFHYGWAHSSVAQNAVLVNGQGQIKHSAAPHGRIAESEFSPGLDYICGDATAAYGPLLKRYERRVAFLKGPQPIIVIYDDLVAASPATFQFMLHGLAEFDVDAQAGALKLSRPKAGLVVRYLSPAPLEFRQWDGYNPPPSRPFPNQWHVEASSAGKRSELGMLTLLVPHRAGAGPELGEIKRLESGTAIGLDAVVDGQPRRVLFRKHGAAAGGMNGEEFPGPVFAR